MTLRGSPGGCVLSLLISITSVCDADEYDFEMDLGFDRTTLDTSLLLAPPGGAIFESGDTDTDEVTLNSAWYFNGLSDSVGPRARAVFVNRASSLGVSYRESDRSTSFSRTNADPLSTIPPIESESSEKSERFAVDLVYVDRDSGWFGGAGWLSSDSRVSISDGRTFDNPGVDEWNVSIGKYLLPTTALTLKYDQVDLRGSSDMSTITAEVTHLGNLGDRWQYAVDLGYGRSDSVGSAGAEIWTGAFSLYPTRDVEFGLSAEHVSVYGGRFLFDPDTTALQGFANWFVTPNLQLEARYRVDDINFIGGVLLPDTPTLRKVDQESFGISATLRF